jgi:hypothetical protein
MIIHCPLFNKLMGMFILMVNTMICNMFRNRIPVRYHSNACCYGYVYCDKVL